MATKVLKCPTFRTKNIFWCKSFWFIIQKTVKFQTNFFFPRTHFCWFSFHKKASVIFPCQAQDKNLARLTKTKLHCPRGQGLGFKASNQFVQTLKFEQSFHDWYTRLDKYVRYFLKLKTKANVNPCRGRAAWRAATEPPRTQRRFLKFTCSSNLLKKSL